MKKKLVGIFVLMLIIGLVWRAPVSFQTKIVASAVVVVVIILTTVLYAIDEAHEEETALGNRAR